MEEYLQLYRDASTDMDIYPLFQALDAIDGWNVNDCEGSCYISVSIHDRYDIIAKAKAISCLTVVDEEETSLGVYIDHANYGGNLAVDILYLRWLWHPMRKSTVEKGIVKGYKADQTYDTRIKYILEHAPYACPVFDEGMIINPLRHLYDQIKHLEWTMDRDRDGQWMLNFYDDVPQIEHPLYNPSTRVINHRVPAIIERMELHYHPILHDQR